MLAKIELMERLDFWQTALSELRKAYLALVKGGVKSYRINNRELTRFDIPALEDEIANAERKVDSLTAQMAGQRPRRATGVCPQDW